MCNKGWSLPFYSFKRSVELATMENNFKESRKNLDPSLKMLTAIQG